MAIIEIKDKSNLTPFEETHYYKWLVENNIKSVHSIETKCLYLETLGFKVGIDKISEDDNNRLNYIGQYYARGLHKETEFHRR